MGKTGARAYSGHQTSFRNKTREELLAFGAEHAPEKVDPPDHSQDKRNPLWARLAAAEVNLMQCFTNWLILEEMMVSGRYVTDSGLRPQERAFRAAAKDHRRLLKEQNKQDWPAPKALKVAGPNQVMLGEVEIEMGEGQYHRPGLSVMHSSQNKSLAVTLYASGRNGKQKNYYPLRREQVGDQVEISTGGATKSLISLAEWQDFIDQVEVRVSNISENTVEMTPELVKMARDVAAYRRQAPTDAEWAAETADQQSLCGVCGSDARLSYSMPRESIGRLWYGSCCRDAVKQWLEIRELSDDMPFREAQRIYLANEFCESPRKQLNNIGYDDTCGMQSKQAWAHGFMMTIFQAWLDAELQPHQSEYKNLGMLTEIGPRGFDSAAHIYLASVGVHRLSGRNKSVVIGDMAWYAVALYDFFARLRYPAKFEAPARPVAPQELQSNEDVLEQFAMSKLLVSPAKIDEMVEAVKVAIAEWNTSADARILPDGYYMYGRPEEAAIPTWVYLKHPSHPNRIVVGEMSIMSDKDTHSELQFVSYRGEIRAYMLKVKAGMKPSTNPKLAGIMMQAPISEPIMIPQIQTLKNHTEGWADFMAVLNDGSAD